MHIIIIIIIEYVNVNMRELALGYFQTAAYMAGQKKVHALPI